jgi:hypothetical protein
MHARQTPYIYRLRMAGIEPKTMVAAKCRSDSGDTSEEAVRGIRAGHHADSFTSGSDFASTHTHTQKERKRERDKTRKPTSSWPRRHACGNVVDEQRDRFIRHALAPAFAGAQRVRRWVAHDPLTVCAVGRVNGRFFRRVGHSEKLTEGQQRVVQRRSVRPRMPGNNCGDGVGNLSVNHVIRMACVATQPNR